MSLSESGADRYALLNQFENPTNASGAPSWSGGTSSPTSNGPGNLDYSPTGAPFSIAAAPEAPTSGTSSPGRESPQAAEQDPFAQAGLDLLHEYCFRAGTRVLTSAGAKPIEDIRPGDLVASVNDRNPDGPVEFRPVEQVYHNAPAEILNVHVRALGVPPPQEQEAADKRPGTLFSGRDAASAMEPVPESQAHAPVGSRTSGGLADMPTVASSPSEPAEAGTASPLDFVLGTTFNHPFHVIGKGWIPARHLEIGDRLRTDDGSTATVTDLFPNGDFVPVFNLRVAGNHTYFVGGNDGQWVHSHSAHPDFPAFHASNRGCRRAFSV